MDLLRSIQKDTGGFTEFVPLSLIHQEAPMYRRGLVPGVRPGATGVEVVKMHAVARLILGPTFRNIQSSWVKEGPEAGAVPARGGRQRRGRHAHQRVHLDVRRRRLRPARAPGRAAAADPRRRARAGAAQHRVRSLKVYGGEEDEEDSPLDHVDDAEARFGSYRKLAASSQFRFLHPIRSRPTQTCGASLVVEREDDAVEDGAALQ